MPVLRARPPDKPRNAVFMGLLMYAPPIAICIAVPAMWASGWLHTLPGLIAALLAALLVGWCLIEPYFIEYTHQELRIPHRQFAPVRIVHISDMHVHGPLPQLSEWLYAKAIVRINRERPDFVIATGDFISRGLSWGTAERNLAIVRKLLSGVECVNKFACLGNNDLRDVGGVLRALEQSGFRVLTRDATAVVGDVSFAGADTAFRRAGSPPIPPPAPLRVLLVHEPDMALLGEGFDLALAGHTHGGQVWVGPFVVLPSLGRRLWAGLYDIGGGRRVFVTRGMGNSPLPRVPVRFLCRPEVSVLAVTGDCP